MRDEYRLWSRGIGRGFLPTRLCYASVVHQALGAPILYDRTVLKLSASTSIVN